MSEIWQIWGFYGTRTGAILLETLSVSRVHTPLVHNTLGKRVAEGVAVAEGNACSSSFAETRQVPPTDTSGVADFRKFLRRVEWV